MDFESLRIFLAVADHGGVGVADEQDGGDAEVAGEGEEGGALVVVFEVGVDDDALALPCHPPRWVPVSGEDDGRALDSLGRRNGHGGRRPDVSRTLRA